MLYYSCMELAHAEPWGHTPRAKTRHARGDTPPSPRQAGGRFRGMVPSDEALRAAAQRGAAVPRGTETGRMMGPP